MLRFPLKNWRNWTLINNPVIKSLYSSASSKQPLKILLIDERGGGSDILIANDIAAKGAQVYLLLQSRLKLILPRNIIQLPAVSLSPESLVDSVDRAVRTHNPDVVLPMSEAALYRLWDDSPDWLQRVQPDVPPAMRAYYRDRHLMGAFMRDRGILTPETKLLSTGTADEVLSIVDEFGLPVVVKGPAGEGGAQVRIVETREEAVAAVNRLVVATHCFPTVQEHIDGFTYQVGGLFDDGRPVHLLAGKKTQMLPARTGPAIALRGSCDPELLAAATNVFSILAHSGIAGADFIRGADGRFRFLEINPRIWGSWDFARAMGVNLFGAWLGQLCEEHQPTATIPTRNRHWAKMPEYLYVEPRTRTSMLRRLLHPVAIRSWSWHNPYALLHQIRRAYWSFRHI